MVIWRNENLSAPPCMHTLSLPYCGKISFEAKQKYPWFNFIIAAEQESCISYQQLWTNIRYNNTEKILIFNYDHASNFQMEEISFRYKKKNVKTKPFILSLREGKWKDLKIYLRAYVYFLYSFMDMERMYIELIKL